MSGVATLKLRGAKRHFDEMAVDLPLPPQGCSPARFVIRPPPLKRGRCTPSPSPSPSRPSKHAVAAAHHGPALAHPAAPPASGSAATGPAHSAAASPSNAHAPPPPLPRLSEEELAALARHVPKRLKRVVDKVSSGEVTLADRLFSVADLREIVTSVLAEKEAKLSDEFAKILNQRLAEQFRDFTKFNEDYVTRQFRGRDYAYLS